MGLVLGLIVNAVALWAATLIVPGISLHESEGIYAPGAGAIENQVSIRSEERRVGKECRSRWSPYH